MGKWGAENLDDWVKGSADGRATTRYDDQEAWSGAYEGKYDVSREEGPYTGSPYLKVEDNAPDDYQTSFREEHDSPSHDDAKEEQDK